MSHNKILQSELQLKDIKRLWKTFMSQTCFDFIQDYKSKVLTIAGCAFSSILGIIYLFIKPQISIMFLGGALAIYYCQSTHKHRLAGMIVLGAMIGLQFLRIKLWGNYVHPFNIAFLPSVMLMAGFLMPFKKAEMHLVLLGFILLNKYFQYLAEEEMIDNPQFCQDVVKIIVRQSHKYMVFVWICVQMHLISSESVLEKLWNFQESLRKELKEEMLKNKNKLLLGLSHEFRNPINTALGNLQLVFESLKSTPDIQKQQLTNIQISIQMIHHVVSNLLDTAKLDDDRLEIAPSQTVFADVIENLWTFQKTQINKKGLHGRIIVSKEIPQSLWIDPQLLRNIINNLMLNAIKYTDQGGVMMIASWVKKDHIAESDFVPSQVVKQYFYDDTNKKLVSKSINSKNNQEIEEEQIDSEYLNSIPNELNTSSEKNILAHSLPSFDSIMTIDKITQIFSKYSFLSSIKEKFSNSINKEKQQREVFHSEPNYQNNQKGFLKLEFFDSGSGIDPEILSDKSLTIKKYGGKIDSNERLGTGLGLWLVKSICKKVKGEVRAFSNKNEGSQLVVMIPTESKMIHHPPQQSDLNYIKSNQSQEITCLIVEDDKFNRELYLTLLKKLKIRVVGEAVNGKEGYQIYSKISQSESIDFILMDIEMPIMNGKESSKLIRKFEVEKGILPTNICFVTGNCDYDEHKQCIDQNGEIRANTFLRKPISLNFLEQTINNFRREKYLRKYALLLGCQESQISYSLKQSITTLGYLQIDAISKDNFVSLIGQLNQSLRVVVINLDYIDFTDVLMEKLKQFQSSQKTKIKLVAIKQNFSSEEQSQYKALGFEQLLEQQQLTQENLKAVFER